MINLDWEPGLRVVINKNPTAAIIVLSNLSKVDGDLSAWYELKKAVLLEPWNFLGRGPEQQASGSHRSLV